MSKEVCSWVEIEAQLPDSLPRGSKKMLKGYFRVKTRSEEGQKKRALQLSHMLNKVTGFTKLEDQYEGVFAAIDIAVNGRTNRKIEPAFKIES